MPRGLGLGYLYGKIKRKVFDEKKEVDLLKTDDPVLDVLSDRIKKMFSSVPQQVYILDDGYDRQILISSLSTHNITYDGAFVCFNLFCSEKNAVFLTNKPYYIHAVAGNASEILAKDIKSGAKNVVDKGSDYYLWTIQVQTEHEEYVLGKKLVIAKVLEAKEGGSTGSSAVYQDRQFWSI